MCCVDVASFFSMISSIFNYFLVVASSLGVMESLVHMNCHFISEGSMFYSSTQLENGWLLAVKREGAIKKIKIRGPSGECHFSHLKKITTVFWTVLSHFWPSILFIWWGNSSFGPWGKRPIVGKFIFICCWSLPSLDATLANSLYCGVSLYRAFCPARGDIYHIIEKL